MGQVRYMGIKIVQVTTRLGLMYSACGSLWFTIDRAKKAIRNDIKINK